MARKKRTYIYKRSQDIEIPARGVVYYLGNRIASVVTSDAVIKSLDGWDYNSDLAYECLDIWRSRGFNGAPASPASFFREEMAIHCAKYGLDVKPLASANNLFHEHTQGGWIESRKSGVCRGAYYHYDINSAYFWASERGLPMRLRPYEKGDKHYVAIMRRPRSYSVDLPNIFERGELVLVTSEDVNYYHLRGEIVDGVSYTDHDFQASDVLAELWYLPQKALKRALQSYWGTFASREPLTAVSYMGGTEMRRWTLGSPSQNMTWANIIVRRVVRRVHGAMLNGGVLCFVDSVLVPYEMRTGSEPGEWKEVERFPTGVYVHCAGVWDSFPVVSRRYADWYRHAGYAQDPEQLYRDGLQRMAGTFEPSHTNKRGKRHAQKRG